MRYPRAAFTSNVQGRPIVRFTLGRDGRLLSVELVTGSGHRVLDEEAVATIKRAAPFPAFPAELTQAEKTWDIPVNFEILRR
jgi:protein TonB